jgi:hypothetical protein
MNDQSRETRETPREAAVAEPAGRENKKSAERIAMLFSALSWTFNVRLGRSGREEGEGIMLVGEITYRTATGDRHVHPARAMVVKADARKRLDLVLAPQDAVLTIPLEPFAMQRLQDRLKDLVSGYGMSVRIGFSAEEDPERQVLEAVDFAFSSSQRTTAEARPAQARDR